MGEEKEKVFLLISCEMRRIRNLKADFKPAGVGQGRDLNLEKMASQVLWTEQASL